MVRVLKQLKLERGVPKVLFCDNRSEFTGQGRLQCGRYPIRISKEGHIIPTDSTLGVGRRIITLALLEYMLTRCVFN